MKQSVVGKFQFVYRRNPSLLFAICSCLFSTTSDPITCETYEPLTPAARPSAPVPAAAVVAEPRQSETRHPHSQRNHLPVAFQRMRLLPTRRQLEMPIVWAMMIGSELGWAMLRLRAMRLEHSPLVHAQAQAQARSPLRSARQTAAHSATPATRPGSALPTSADTQ
jgi:hypothetical protein